MDEKRQVQKELFEEFGSTEKRRYPKNAFQQKSKRTITLLYEHLVFVAIGIIVFSIIIFSLGVERGKSISLRRGSFAAKEREGAVKVRLAKVLKPAEETVIEEEKDSVPSHKYEKEPVSGYTVQVASYTSEGFAKRWVGKLQSEGYEAFTLQKGSYYIMCIGKFRDKKSAVSEMKKLRKLYSDCFVRKIN
jgi:septal ring-binding cell division protein DamX